MTTDSNSGLPGAVGGSSDVPTQKIMQPVTFDGLATTSPMSADTAAHRLEKQLEKVSDVRRQIQGSREALETQRHIYEAAQTNQLEFEQRYQSRLDELEATLPALEAAVAAATLAASRATAQAELDVLEGKRRAERDEGTRIKQLRADLKNIDLQTGGTS